MTSTEFGLRTTMVAADGGVQLVADPIGGSLTYRTHEVLIQPGDRLTFTIANALSQSHLVRR